MRNLFKTLVIGASAVLLATPAMARDQLRIVGSSTVYPFSSYVAEEFKTTTKFGAPIVESTGSGGGHKLFGQGLGDSTPDITNSSRRMKASEFEANAKAGVTDITEVVVGFDGIAVCQNAADAPMPLTLKELALAVLEEVPVDGKLVKNPYKSWKDLNPALPDRKIVFYGPPTTSGTRDAFEEMVLEKVTHKLPEYGGKAYKNVRQDGGYVPSGENDNLIVQKLTKDKDALGIFGYSYLAENKDRIQGLPIDGVKPEPASVTSGKYPVSRSLYFYVKDQHIGKVAGIEEYVNLFLSEKMIGDGGLLEKIGLIPLPKDKREAMRKDWAAKKKLTAEDLK